MDEDRQIPGQIVLRDASCSESRNSSTNEGISSLVSRGSSKTEGKHDKMTKIRKMMQPHVSTLIFPRKQFVVNITTELPWDRGAGSVLKKRLSLQALSDEEWKVRWEESYREATRQALKIKRNNVAGEIKKVMLGKDHDRR